MGTSDAACALSALDQRGFWSADRPVADQVLTELRHLARILPDDVDGQWVSTAIESSISPAERMELDRSIRKILAPSLELVLPGHRPFMASMFTKGPGALPTPYHQDLTYTDEAVDRSYVVWIPLVDVGPDNGALRVVPGSHRWSRGIRAMGPGGLSPLLDESPLLEATAEWVSLRAGQMMVFDVALAHGSAGNASCAPRPAAAINVAPSRAELTICFRTLDGPFQRFAMDDDYLAEPVPFRSPPTRKPRLMTFDGPDPTIEIPRTSAPPQAPA